MKFWDEMVLWPYAWLYSEFKSMWPYFWLYRWISVILWLHGRSGGFGYIGGHMKLGSGKMGVWSYSWLYVEFICIWPRFPLR